MGGVKFTITYDQSCHDCVLGGDYDTLTMDLFVKTTDRNSMLHSESGHPYSVKNYIPQLQYQSI